MNYKGVIIEESLEHPGVLREVKILNTDLEKVTEEHKTPWVEYWNKHEVEIPEDRAQEIADKVSQSMDIKHAWYADFKNEKFHYIIFRNKIFKIDLQNPKYKEVMEYGVSLGIPDYQLDFSPEIEEWKRNKMISFEQFKEVELKVAEILSAENVEGSEKLLRLKVSLGNDPSTDSGHGERQILAGIAKQYAPEDLIGKQIVIVANLEPKEMMGQESQGMLLAADTPEGPILLVPERKSPLGSSIR